MKFLLFYRINGIGLFGKFLLLFYLSYFLKLIVSGIVVSTLMGESIKNLTQEMELF